MYFVRRTTVRQLNIYVLYKYAFCARVCLLYVHYTHSRPIVYDGGGGNGSMLWCIYFYTPWWLRYSFYDCQQRIANIKNSTKRNQYFSHTKHARQLKLKLFFPLTYTNTCVCINFFCSTHKQTHMENV